jgi:glycosyltransferase involved in cell wall biosynthesis
MHRHETAVSVVIPTYNRSSLVSRCVDSIRASGVVPLEVIVVDDGGTDDTEAVVAGRATYLRQTNAGPAAARNNGFDSSKGGYVAFIDSDDEWIGDAACRLQRQLQEHPNIDVVFADSRMGNETDGFVSFVETYGGPAFAALPGTGHADGLRILERAPLFRQLSTRNVMFLGSMLIRRDFFARIGGFDPRLRGAADWDFFMRATAAGTVAFSPGPAVSYYYKHSEGMSTDQDHMEEDFIRALDSVLRRAPLDDAARAHVESRLRDHIFGWAWLAYEKGDLQTTRTRLQMAVDMGQFGAREAVYLATSYFPPALVDAMRRARRILSTGRG